MKDWERKHSWWVEDLKEMYDFQHLFLEKIKHNPDNWIGDCYRDLLKTVEKELKRIRKEYKKIYGCYPKKGQCYEV